MGVDSGPCRSSRRNVSIVKDCLISVDTFCMKKGDRVHTKNGKHGTVHSVHHGTYIGVVHSGIGVSYYPAAHVEPEGNIGATPSNPDPDHDSDNDMVAKAEAQWERHTNVSRLIEFARGPN